MKKKTPSQRPKPLYNLKHEDIRHKIEFAFTAGGKRYYRFIDDHQIPTGRYKYIYATLKEVDLRMNIDTLKEYIKEMKNILNGGASKNNVSMENLWRIILNMESRISLAFEPASVRRLASVIFFDDTEDLRTYDKKYGTEKIAFWEKHNVLDFFLTMPIVELLGLKGISPESLVDYIETSQQILDDLTLDLRNPSSENLSENGKNPL